MEELDVVEHPLIEGNGNIVVGSLQIGLNRNRQLRCRRRRQQRCRNREQLVNRRRLVFLLREAVCLGKALQLVLTDSIGQTVEVFTKTRFARTIPGF